MPPSVTASIIVKWSQIGQDQLNQQFTQLKNQLGNTATVTKQVGESAEKSSQGFQVFGHSLVDTAAKLYLIQVGVRNVLQAMEGMFKLAELGAQVQQSDISFAHLLQTLGAAPDTMDRLREAAGGLATDYELQSKSAIVLTGTSGELGRQLADNLPALMEIARAAKVVNPAIRDVDYAYESLTTGIKRGEKRWLDNIGIIFRAEDAYKAYAEKLGLASAEQLTAEQRQLAFLEMTLKVGEEIKRQAGGIESLTDKYGTLKTNLTEVKQAGGVFLNEFLGPSIDKINELMGSVDKSSDRWAEFGRVLSPIASIFTEIWIAMEKMQYVVFVKFNPMIGPLVQVVSELAKLDERTGLLGGKLAEAKTSLENFTSGLEDVPPVAEAGADAADKFGDAWHNALMKLADEQATNNKKLREASADYRDKVLDETQKLEDKLSDIHAKAADQRYDVDKSFNERATELNERYYEQRAKLEKRLRELQEKTPLTETEREIQQVQRQVDDPNTPEGYKAYLQLRLADLQNKLREEQKQANIKELQDELAQLDAKHEAELAKLQKQASEKFAIITREEEDATAKTQEESGKRLRGWQDDLIKLNKSIQETYKENWLEALLSVSEKGSDVNRMLEDQLLRVKGLDEATIAYYRNLEMAVTGPAGISQLATMLGFLGAQPSTNDAVLQAYLQQIGGGGNWGIHRQRGGSVMAGGGYIVGEAGPELFMPKSSGTIIPNNVLGGGMNVSISAGAFLGSRADAIRLGNELAPIIARSLKAHGIQIQ